MKTLIWHVILACLIALVSWLFKSDITYSDVTSVVSILQNGSAMIFTIMGIWIAYIYPQAMRKVIQPSSSAIFPEEDKKRVQLLVGVVVISAVILAILLIGISMKPFLVNTSLYLKVPELFSFVGLFVLLCLVYAQLFCIYSVIASNINFITDLANKENGQKLEKKLKRTTED
ncbi:hypothetical protein KO533_19010 [Shewanella sp. NKUCC05_KAH]|uniref:hypothetical protein n=1 Tax=Shewanella sp. NKUCC05_KAH TaxID=2842126 RepID=UPI001C5AA6F1|nr:hypothetical protein [Shewanella sp. NKUCC05_KAH]MBW3528642.1 hypothetical protein [Shewanella sp. NKUCC05_KAH]